MENPGFKGEHAGFLMIFDGFRRCTMTIKFRRGLVWFRRFQGGEGGFFSVFPAVDLQVFPVGIPYTLPCLPLLEKEIVLGTCCQPARE